MGIHQLIEKRELRRVGADEMRREFLKAAAHAGGVGRQVHGTCENKSP